MLGRLKYSTVYLLQRGVAVLTQSMTNETVRYSTGFKFETHKSYSLDF